MKRIASPEQLEKIRKDVIKGIPQVPCITISSGTCGLARGSEAVVQAFKEEIKGRNLEDKVAIKMTGCHGFCQVEPNIIIQPEGIFYVKVKPEDAGKIITETVLNKKVIEPLLYTDPLTGEEFVHEKEIPFYNKQQRTVLEKNPQVDPTKITDYLVIGGYRALAKALSEMSPERIIEEVKKSGLRGRGGAGFPTGFKWDFCRRAKGDKRYIICNADEGDPGAYMDRSLLEGNPHSVLEGMLIGAYAIGADEGIIYVRNEYPLSVKNVTIALEQARECGLLGRNILGSGFDFEIRIKRGAGAFVCGEETALIASIEGRRGEPRQRPPFPAIKGLWGKPTNINNVETWANVPLIINKGADWYSSIGTERSKGTKIFSLVGKINNTGLVEVPMGISLGEIIFDIGGGIPEGKRFKAVQTGGPSGGCIPRDLLNLPVDYDKLAEVGSIMGSGGMVVMDEDTCMVDVAKYFLNFLQDESCGKCLSCREGIRRMLEIVADITEGRGKIGDLELLEELAQVVKDTSQCGLGQTAPNPVLSTLRCFRDEYEAHIKQRKCPAGVCRELFISPCQNACPAGMNVPGYVSLIGEGRFQEALELALDTNPFPSICGRVCDHPCMSKCRRNQIDEPVAIRMLKRFIGDYEHGKLVLPPGGVPKEKLPHRVGIVGAGPAGLSCAYFLARLGYQPTVFEALPVAGGMLSIAIPENRLPKNMIQREIERIKAMGVEIDLFTQVGRDVTLLQLLDEGYEAFYVAVGMYGDRRMGIPGEELQGVIQGVDFLRDVNLKRRVKMGKRVVVVGGGNSAIDAARTALRLGAEEVTILYRRTRQEMPAFEEEIEQALQEGVKLELLVAPTKIIEKENRVHGVEVVRMMLGEFDSSGRRRPIPQPDQTYRMEVDTVIPAIGEFADIRELFTGLEVETHKDGTVKTNEWGMTSILGVFSGGDVATGPATVIRAVAAGERGAVAIDQHLRPDRTRVYPWRVTKHVDTYYDLEAEPVPYGQVQGPTLSVDARKGNFKEVDLGYTAQMAMKEAKRCLRCDLEVDLEKFHQWERSLRAIEEVEKW